MQIDSALPSTLPAPDRAITKSVSEDDGTASQSALSETPGQDSAVHISAEGAAAAAQDASTAQGDASGDSTGESASTSDVSAAKSFAYGTLGLERPDQPQETHNAFYTAGRWLAAGLTIGGIISLLA